MDGNVENDRKRSDEEQLVSRVGERNETNNNYLDDASNDDVHCWNLVRVTQRIRVQRDAKTNDGVVQEEIWALMEWERDDIERDMIDNNNNTGNYHNNTNTNTNTTNNSSSSSHTKQRWKRFESETALQDFVRRDTGEPVTLPPYSLSPHQSSRITTEAENQVAAITADYRRFRVKAEMTRKTLDAQIRDVQAANVETTKRQIEGQEQQHAAAAAAAAQENSSDLTRRSEHHQLERMRAEAAQQEAQWKEAYDSLLQENEALTSSGSDAILASQWRQRYETCRKEKDEAVQKLQSIQQRSHSYQIQQSSASFSSPPNVRGGGGANRSINTGDGKKYERKYRDLKESFRLYRKKAKEIFESQAVAAATRNSIGGTKTAADMMVLQMSSSPHANAEEDSKVSYLKNLMVNYLTADPEVRDHMEVAIGTVLKFTPDDIAAIGQKKEAEASWGIF